MVGAGHPARVACGHAELSLRVAVLRQSFLLSLLQSRLVCPQVLSSNTSKAATSAWSPLTDCSRKPVLLCGLAREPSIA